MADALDIAISGINTPRTDFSPLGQILPSYWKGLEQGNLQEKQAALKGIPTLPNGEPDYKAITAALFKYGDTGPGASIAGLDLQRQQLALGQDVSRTMATMDNPAIAPAGIPRIGPAGPGTFPPSPQQQLPAPPQNPPVSRPQGAQQPDTVRTIFMAANPSGNPDDPAIDALAKRAGVEHPDQPLPPQIAQRLTQAFTARGPGSPPSAVPVPAPDPRLAQAPGAGAPVQPQPQMAPQGAPVNPGAPQPGSAPTPPDFETQKKIAFLTEVLSNPALKANHEAAKVRLEALLKQQEQTGIMKEWDLARRQGYTGTFQQFQDENKQEHIILQHSILPKIDKSQEQATAARDAIYSLGNTKKLLDEGIISGAFADKRLMIQKVGALLGFTNEQIATTEAFKAAMGDLVKSTVKAFGSGTAISNADRAYAEKIVGGNIELDARSMQRIFDIMAKGAQRTVGLHNELVTRVAKNSPVFAKQADSYRVDPGAPQQQAPQQQQQGGVPEGATATNSQTGAKLIYQGGAWKPVPAPTAVAPRGPAQPGVTY